MLTAYLKRQWKLLLLLAGAVAVFAAVFALYSLPVEAVAYAGLLCLMLGLVLFALGYSAFLRRHRELEGLLRKVHESVLPLPPPGAYWRRTIRPAEGGLRRPGCVWRRRTGTGWRT